MPWLGGADFMTDALNATVPAGWYPDPWGSASQRWWDGAAWTDKLHSSTESASAPATPEPATPEPATPKQQVATDATYTPAAVRSTYEPAAPHTDAPASAASPLRSRRAMRELTETPAAESVPVATESTAPSLPPLTQTPEFSPEPVSALPAPVWTEPQAAPAAVAEPAPAPTPAAVASPAATESPASAPVPIVAKAATAPATPAEADDGWAASLTRWEDVEATSAQPDTAPIFGDAPPVSYSQRAMRYQPMHGRTSGVWLIVFIPLLQALATLGSMFLFPGLLRFDAQWAAFVPAGDPMSFLVNARDWILFAIAPLTIAFFVFTLVLGFQDRSRLRLLGHDQTASPWWIVLSPLIYLIVRSVRVRQSTGRRGSGPLTTYICLYVAPPLALFIAQTVTSSLYGAIPV